MTKTTHSYLQEIIRVKQAKTPLTDARRFHKTTRRLLFIILLVCAFNASTAQTGAIQILRYNDDFAYLKNDSVKKGFDRLKYIRLDDEVFVSFGGELREQYQYFDQINFGDIPPTSSEVSTDQLWHRLMVFGDLAYKDRFRLFVQLSNTLRFFNPNPVTPQIDENQLSLHQAFVDLKLYKNWLFRIGRQEVGYGSNRIITFREGPNTRQTFDAIFIKHVCNNRYIDFFAMTPVVSRQYVFDDVSFKEKLWGIYANEIVNKTWLSVDYYFIDFRSDERRYNYVPGSEHRQTVGTRLFSHAKSLNYELEVMYQFGSFNEQQIRAYALHGDVNVRLENTTNLLLGVAFNYTSGDEDRNDNKLNTYNTLYTKPPFGLILPIGLANIVNVNPYFRINPVQRVFVYGTVCFLQRQSTQDGTYTPGMAQNRPRPNASYTSENRKIGQIFTIESAYNVNRNLSFYFDVSHAEPGAYAIGTGNGKRSNYIATKATLKF